MILCCDLFWSNSKQDQGELVNFKRIPMFTFYLHIVVDAEKTDLRLQNFFSGTNWSNQKSW